MSANTLIIAGPTGSGKSSLALTLAQQLDGVIINADSVQVYEGMPLITAQPSIDDYQSAPHKLYATYHPKERCDAQLWRDTAIQEINAALENNKLPIVVGGTGFYLLSLLEGFSPIPDVSKDVRDAANALHKELGNPAFHTELCKRDPAMAEKLNPNDTQRLIRAWEIIEATGESLAHWQSLPKEGAPEHLAFHTVNIDLDREILYARINTRFEQMCDAGALDEVKTFRARIETGDVPEDTPLIKAYGYQQLCAYLDGACSLDEAIAESQKLSRHYAKRQVTWLRHQLKAAETVQKVEKFAESVENIKSALN